MKRVLSR